MFGLLVLMLQAAGVVLLLIAAFGGGPVIWAWGWGLTIAGLVLYVVIKLMNRAERQHITEQAVRGVGAPPPPAVQKQLWAAAMKATMDRSAPSIYVIENYGQLCRMWVERHGDTGR
ncbi:hypothetical protein [Leifsonia sp. Leaf264]|uniref:hypothetical protein n=1 Tax=Leifsonia sp. Leaf264 TaxID=1736314 RepID=UPI0006FEC4C9|nr:hypothetical protein [Leifsonia sp. Leaf264]KQO98450.1 hypothetical protein ASF30_10335 [Leifsonia sp. Leaf264]